MKKIRKFLRWVSDWVVLILLLPLLFFCWATWKEEMHSEYD